MKYQKAQELLQKYLNGNCTEDERQLLEQWYQQHQASPLPVISEADKNRQLKEIYASLPIPTRSITRRLWLKIAAAVILLATAGLFIVRYTHKSVAVNQTMLTTADVAPGGNRATLKLANGQTIDLDNEKTGIQLTNNHVVYTDGTNLRTSSSKNSISAPEDYQTLTTPRGGQYQLILSDGTKVWLNAASTIKYPAHFNGIDRSVEIDGEVYFAVNSTNPLYARKPFYVKTNGFVVMVMGTEFNISSYLDEKNTCVTLVKGSVKVGTLDRADNLANLSLLHPGQKSIMHDQHISIQKANVEQDISWKNGVFTFQNTDIQEVMRQLSRWYNVKVVFEGPPMHAEINGIIYRDMSLKKVVEVLKHLDINLYTTGNELVVVNK
ncbi:FecR family protein [bacterium A37T11]|nr:FecR family protein [bacterium A37T11]